MWAADITYLPMARGFLYLMAVMDWHSRYVLAWRLSNTPRPGSGAGSGGRLLRRGAGGGSGQGTARGVQHRPKPPPAKAGGGQFTSLEFAPVLQDRGVKISMDGKGRYQDNIFVERLWRTVKYEEVYLKAYASVLEAQKGLEDYFRFYNGLRPHQALGYRTPAEVFHGDQGDVDGESNGRRCPLEKGTQSLAGEPEFSLSSALILSK